MLRALPVHLTAIAVLIGATALVVAAIGPALPAVPLQLLIGLVGAFSAGWLLMLGLRFRTPRDGGDRTHTWRAQDRAVMWIGSLVSAAGYWLVMPYADDALKLMLVIFQFGPIAVGVMTGIEPGRRSVLLAPLILPISTVVFFLVYWDRFSLAVIAFSIAYAFVVMSLRRVMQRAVDRAFAARRAAEAALVQVAAERDAKTRFLTSASHDLHQPVLAARLFLHQALHNPNPDQRAEAGRGVTAAFDSMDALLRQMLDHLRLESGAVTASIADVEAEPLIARVADLNAPAAGQAGVALRPLSTRLKVSADPVLLERALGNLVGNAIRHAKGRRVLIGARRHGARVRLWVIDDGEGIHEADVPQLFDDYVQGSTHGDELRGGFGLGLASTRRMVGLMGGGVGLERRWTGGAAFWLDLPAA